MELHVDAIFMNSGYSKTADIHRLLPKLSESQKTKNRSTFKFKYISNI